MHSIHWFEAKQLDGAINFSSRTEIIKIANKRNIHIKYYCSFKKEKKSFGLDNNIQYLGNFKNRFLKGIQFRLLVILKSIQVVLSNKNQIIIVNQYLILFIIPAYFLSKIFNQKNKFIVDIRTTPVTPSTFEKDMIATHKQFKLAVRYFDGLSFITPFMANYIMANYKKKLPTVFWSSGVNLSLFDFSKFPKTSEELKSFNIFYHGSICESRGNLDLIKACQKLINKGYNVRLIQVGLAGDNEIKKYIDEQKLNSWCKLLPAVPINEIPQYIADSDLPVLPFPNFMAWRVSSPIKLMEYLAMGKKVLAPDIEAFTDVFTNDPHLIYYYRSKSSNQIEEISNRIEEIIIERKTTSFNPKEAIQFVKSNYTWEIQGNKLIDFCQTL